MRFASVVAGLAACAACAATVVAGCGSGQETVTGTSGTTQPASTTPTPTPTSRPAHADDQLPDGDPETTLRSYFDDVDSGELDAAWALLSPAVREQLGGYDSWSDGIERRESTTLASVQPAGGPEDEPAFEVEVRTVEDAPCGLSAERTFTGTWTLEPDDTAEHWRIASSEQTLVSGPPDLEVLCATSDY